MGILENFCSGCGNEVNGDGDIVHSQGCPRVAAMQKERDYSLKWVKGFPIGVEVPAINAMPPTVKELDSEAYNAFITNQKLTQAAAVKYDDDKPRLDLIPPDALYAVAEILSYGAVKYGARNWEKGLEWHRLYRAAVGHMLSFWFGEEYDQESKLPHLWHAACCILMLVSTVKRFPELDDRSKPHDRSRVTSSDSNGDAASSANATSQPGNGLADSKEAV
jgi:hypothetical protein